MILRRWVVVLGVALLLAGAVAAAKTGRIVPAVGAAIPGLAILLGTLFERITYRRTEDRPPPGPNWQPTSERFRDPLTDDPGEVFFNPSTGERRYVSRRN